MVTPADALAPSLDRSRHRRGGCRLGFTPMDSLARACAPGVYRTGSTVIGSADDLASAPARRTGQGP